MLPSHVSRRGILSVCALGVTSSCLEAAATDATDATDSTDRRADLRADRRADWEASDEVPERDDVNRVGTAPELSTTELRPFRPAYAPLVGSQQARTNRRYGIELEADDEVDVLVLDETETETEADAAAGETAVEAYMNGDAATVSEYSAEAVRSYSETVPVPDDRNYGLLVDFHDASRDRRRLEGTIRIDASLEAYYFLPFDEYEAQSGDE